MKRNSDQLEKVRELLNAEQHKLLEVVSELGASSWLNAVPLKQYLDKHAFRDAIFQGYGIPLKKLP